VPAGVYGEQLRGRDLRADSNPEGHGYDHGVCRIEDAVTALEAIAGHNPRR